MTPTQRNTLIAFLLGLFGLGGYGIGHSTNPTPAPTPAPDTAVVKPTPTPTPVPETTVTPVPVPPPTSSGSLSAFRLLGEDFTSYGSTAALLANVSTTAGGTGNYATVLYSDGYNAQSASIDQSVKYNGHQTLKYTFPAGSAKAPALWVNWHTGALKIFWYRAKIRFTPGFTTVGTLPNTANAYKLLGWGWNTYDGSGRVEITNTNQYDFTWTVQAKSTGKSIGGGAHANAGTIAGEWTDGRWYDYVVEVDFSKSPGVARLWIGVDGQTPALRGTAPGSMTDGSALPGLTGVDLGLNINQAATQVRSLNYGQWEVIDGVAHPNPYGLL